LRTTGGARRNASFDSAATAIESSAIQSEMMKRTNQKIALLSLLISTFLAAVPTTIAAPTPEPNISVVGYFGTDKAQKENLCACRL
jgi:hypothetical protein